MSEDIKEILNELKNEDNYIEDYGFRYKKIALDDVWYLLDYITNLEQRIDKAIEYMNNYIEVEDAPINERIKIEFKEVINILTGGSDG